MSVHIHPRHQCDGLREVGDVGKEVEHSADAKPQGCGDLEGADRVLHVVQHVVHTGPPGIRVQHFERSGGILSEAHPLVRVFHQWTQCTPRATYRETAVRAPFEGVPEVRVGVFDVRTPGEHDPA